MIPGWRRTLSDATGPARARVSAPTVTIAREAHEHVGHDDDDPRSIVPRQVRAVLAHFAGHRRDIARCHPAAQKHLMRRRQEIACQHDGFLDQIAQSQCLGSRSPPVPVRCTVLHCRDPAQGIVLKVPRASQVPKRVLHPSLPVHPGSAPRTRPFGGSKRGCQRLPALDGRVRSTGHSCPFNELDAAVASKFSVVV